MSLRAIRTSVSLVALCVLGACNHTPRERIRPDDSAVKTMFPPKPVNPVNAQGAPADPAPAGFKCLTPFWYEHRAYRFGTEDLDGEPGRGMLENMLRVGAGSGVPFVGGLQQGL